MKNLSALRLFAVAALIAAASFSINAQTDRELGEATIQALTLYKQERFIEAIPH